ncbi:hypothetical protein [Pseudomonas chlororaphis]|uniref:hypothetical protein n=1 Tax=Pseudomonas chlororaphis TaxID=587753 RepID=UPI000F5717C3|nr:hypothetical protein [Pseudomonas chlororaphis]AZD22464.1 hypothetical protein C4K24_3161 [Pseudomonas chlororaphis subsp. aurantiaca]QQX61921.1 hypothetical protein JHW28_15655 [Pseudomonas chlororaphis subsp. aurantiaca]
MNRRTLTCLAVVALCSGGAFAQSCDVVTRSQSADVANVDTHTCYLFEGMPAEAIGWSCSNESTGTLAQEKEKVANCDESYLAVCRARLTQEALSNPRATAKDPQGSSLNIPDKARVVTFYYQAEHLEQARTDCEMAGGKWQWK